MIEKGIVCVQDIPDDYPLSINQKRIVECVKCGQVRVDTEIKKMVQEIQWPAYYLDFETTMTALPLYPGVGPYEKYLLNIPFISATNADVFVPTGNTSRTPNWIADVN